MANSIDRRLARLEGRPAQSAIETELTPCEALAMLRAERILRCLAAQSGGKAVNVDAVLIERFGAEKVRLLALRRQSCDPARRQRVREAIATRDEALRSDHPEQEA